jgi:hypothetical protein
MYKRSVNEDTGTSGYTASVMLPADVMKERAEPAPPLVAPPVGGLGATYAAAGQSGLTRYQESGTCEAEG